jgi:hydroxymethylpyrimidine/phosphomethylpyrimidine kinase
LKLLPGAPTVLVIAGHDPTGGAGVDADREALEAGGAASREIVTAYTEQDGVRVRAVRPRDPRAWLAEAREVLADPAGGVRVVKVGLLPGADHVYALAELAHESPCTFVVDPVLRASGGEVFLDAEGIRALCVELLPTGPVLTPNLPEAEALTGMDGLAGASEDAMAARVRAGARLLELGAAAVLVKGGHGTEDPVRNLVLALGSDPAWTEHRRVLGGTLHGSGCRYASSVAAGLARGASLVAAARAASGYVAGLLTIPAD